VSIARPGSGWRRAFSFQILPRSNTNLLDQSALTSGHIEPSFRGSLGGEPGTRSHQASSPRTKPRFWSDSPSADPSLDDGKIVEGKAVLLKSLPRVTTIEFLSDDNVSAPSGGTPCS
jgi:hypothetical protein